MNPIRFALQTTALALALLFVPLAIADEYADVTALLRAGKFTDAQTLVERSLAAKPTDPQLRFFKGVILRNLGNTAEAISTFTKLTEDYPELPEPYNNLAVLYAGQGHFDKARLALEMAIRTNPSYATAHENIGDVYARLASQAYNKALQLDNGNAAVPPKLALIQEIFKANLAAPKLAASAASVPASVLAPVATVPAKAASATTAAPPKAAQPSAGSASASTASAPPAVPAPVIADQASAVQASVQAWAKAWAAKDLSTYLGAYSPAFEPSSRQSRSQWEQERRKRIIGKSSISVVVNDLQVSVQGEQATARFRQSYKADRLSISSRKTLDLQLVGQRWLIVRESTGN